MPRLVTALLALSLCALAIPATAGAKTLRTAVIVMHFSGEIPDAEAEAIAGEIVFGTPDSAIPFGWNVRQYFLAQTYGTVDFAGSPADIYGPVDIGPNPGGCAFSNWINEAQNEAAQEGFDRSAYDKIAFFLDPPSGSCSAGVGGGGIAFMNGFSDYVTLHEFGHTLGSGHAGTLRCVAPDSLAVVPYSPNCSIDESGDPFDPMGNGVRSNPFATPLEMPAFKKLGFGAIPPVDAPTVAYSGAYTIAPLEQSSGMRMLRIPSGDGRFFDLDFRRPTGFFDGLYSPTEPATNGVLIHLDSATLGGDPTLLIDTTPETAQPFSFENGTDGFLDAALTAGRQFRDFRTGVTVETLSTGPAGAVVRIGGLPDPPGPAARCRVPKLARKQVKAAKKSIRKRGCKVGGVKRRHSSKVAKGKVISQRPKARKDLPAGAKVELVVSSGPKRR